MKTTTTTVSKKQRKNYRKFFLKTHARADNNNFVSLTAVLVSNDVGSNVERIGIADEYSKTLWSQIYVKYKNSELICLFF